MKRLSVLFALLWMGMMITCQAPTTTPDAAPTLKDLPGALAESQYYRFYSHFWLNMHHFLYNKAILLKTQPAAEVFDSLAWQTMSESEKAQLDTTMLFYQTHLIDQDLRTGEVHFSFKKWCLRFAESEQLPLFTAAPQFSQILNQSKALYQQHFWPLHDATNRQVLNEQWSLIKNLEAQAVQRLVALTRTEWSKEKIRIDISYHSKLERPYCTTQGGVHVVMDSGNNAQPPGNWIELLFHESSHHLIFPSDCYVSDVIDQVADSTGIAVPRGLWHAYLFYFSGVVTQELLPSQGITDYELYMVRKRPFHWFFPLLSQNLPRYVSKTDSLDKCTQQILQGWQERQKRKKQ